MGRTRDLWLCDANAIEDGMVVGLILQGSTALLLQKMRGIIQPSY